VNGCSHTNKLPLTELAKLVKDEGDEGIEKQYLLSTP
jgi:hypothetical protein